MKTKLKLYICDDCGRNAEFSGYVKARAADWAVAKDYSKCYCPDCAPRHRRGRASTKKKRISLPKGYEQLRIDN